MKDNITSLDSGQISGERAVMVCPQCEGEGFYADGLDEAACSTECTRCGTNGWIVDLATLQAADRTAQGREMVLEEAAKVAEDHSMARSVAKTAALARKQRTEARDHESMAIEGMHIAAAIRALKDQPNDRT